MALNSFGRPCDLVGRHRSSVVMRLFATTKAIVQFVERHLEGGTRHE